MAHKITERDRQEGVEQAWHGLTNIKEVIDLDNCFLTEWEVKPRKLELDGAPTEFNILTGSDDGLPIGKPFANTYKPISNKLFLEMIKDAIKNINGARVESLGSVCNRGRVFVSISIKDKSRWKLGNREFKDYLNFGNGHDQSCVLWVNNTNICTVCDNTFSYNLNSESDLTGKVFHRGDVELKLTNIADIVDAYVGTQAFYKAEFERLLKTPIDESNARSLFAGWMLRNDNEKEPELSSRSFNKVNRLTELFKNGAGNAGQNRADAFSAVTDYYTHESTRGSGKDKRSQFVSSEFGLGKTAKSNFWDTIRDDEAVDEFIDIGTNALANMSV